VSPDPPDVPRSTAMPTRGDGRSLSLTGEKLVIDGRDLVANVIDETVELTEFVIV
jgi:hypothetical protein